eukprot:TRINITY_DN40346_c0_g1_i1.p1 TRINITY_DN40346_c0_g1~~TRINITY_DN40346_c0_g1_i1.p1  ORF type:complete len:444 (-),score=69.64 TRINITY_DN40346_c0_g1_i1:120-1451(-)
MAVGRCDLRRFFAPCAAGLEVVLARELAALGAKDVWRLRRGVEFSATPQIGCRTVLATRTASAVDELLAEASAPLRTRSELYDFVRAARPWASEVGRGDSMWASAAIAGEAASGPLRHQQLTAITTGNAIGEACADVHGVRPPVDGQKPDWVVHLVLHGRGARLSRRWSGRRGLHRRGYRSDVKIHKGALQETMAAGLLLLAGLGDEKEKALLRQGEVGLLDPMCGSGTFLFEALLLALDVAPGILREALSGGAAPQGRWHSVPRELAEVFEGELSEAKALATSACQLGGALPVLRGRDVHPSAIDLSRRCAAALDAILPGVVPSALDLCVADVAAVDGVVSDRRWVVCCNPPWGARLSTGSYVEGDGGQADDPFAWGSLGAFFKRSSSVSAAWVLTPDDALAKALEMELGVSAAAIHRIEGGPRVSSQAPGLQWMQYDLSPS